MFARPQTERAQGVCSPLRFIANCKPGSSLIVHSVLYSLFHFAEAFLNMALGLFEFALYLMLRAIGGLTECVFRFAFGLFHFALDDIFICHCFDPFQPTLIASHI